MGFLEIMDQVNSCESGKPIAGGKPHEAHPFGIDTRILFEQLLTFFFNARGKYGKCLGVLGRNSAAVGIYGKQIDTKFFFRGCEWIYSVPVSTWESSPPLLKRCGCDIQA